MLTWFVWNRVTVCFMRSPCLMSKYEALPSLDRSLLVETISASVVNFKISWTFQREGKHRQQSQYNLILELKSHYVLLTKIPDSVQCKKGLILHTSLKIIIINDISKTNIQCTFIYLLLSSFIYPLKQCEHSRILGEKIIDYWVDSL